MASGHNVEKHYYEYRALLTLQELYPQEYGSFKHGDKPDLYDDGKDMGIEVVRGVDIQFEKHSSFFQKHLQGQMIDEIPKFKVEWFKTYGYTILTKGDLGLEPAKEIIAYHPEASWINTGNLERALRQKIEYIETTDWRVSQLSLYVFSDFFKMYEREDIENLVCFAKELQANNKKKYSLLFIDDCGWFYRCDLTTGEISFWNTDDALHNICVKAKACAEGFNL